MTVDDGEIATELGHVIERRTEALDDRITYLRADVDERPAGLRRDVARLMLVWSLASSLLTAALCVATILAVLLVG